MLDKLTPPTDNLYKFMAICGLIGFVLAVILLVRQVDAMLDHHRLASQDLQDAWIAVGEVEEAQKLLNDSWDHAQEGKSGWLYLQAKEIEGLDENAFASIKRYELSIRTYAYAKAKNIWVQRGIGVLLGISTFVICICFWKWYKHTQQYLDQILKAKAEEAVPQEQQDGPANAGRKWTDEEEQQLRDGFSQNKSYKALAKAHGRTRGAIRARLIKLELIEDTK